MKINLNEEIADLAAFAGDVFTLVRKDGWDLRDKAARDEGPDESLQKMICAADSMHNIGRIVDGVRLANRTGDFKPLLRDLDSNRMAFDRAAVANRDDERAQLVWVRGASILERMQSAIEEAAPSVDVPGV